MQDVGRRLKRRDRFHLVASAESMRKQLAAGNLISTTAYDRLSRMHANLMDGTYDCVDRIVLNAYFRFDKVPGDSDCWWRDPHETGLPASS